MAADPYLALTLDLKRRIAQVSRALEQPHPGPAAWGLWELLEDVWRRKDAKVSVLLLAACFGPDPRWPAALVEIGLLVVPEAGGWELCEEEANRLLSTHRQRVAAGKARAASAGRVAGAFAPAADQRSTSGSTSETSGGPAEHQRGTSPYTQHPAPSSKVTKKKLAGSATADPREGGDATYKALVAALFALFSEHKGGEAYDPSAKDWTALADLRGRHTAAEIIRRWGIGLQARYGARCATFWQLRERWNDCAQPEAQGGAQGHQNRIPNGAATAADKDWT